MPALSTVSVLLLMTFIGLKASQSGSLPVVKVIGILYNWSVGGVVELMKNLSWKKVNIINEQRCNHLLGFES